MINIVKNLIENKQLNMLKNELDSMNAPDIAALFDELTNEEMIIAYRLLSKVKAVDTFAYLEPDKKEALIHAFTDSELDAVINELFMDDAVDLIEEMPSNVVKRILRTVDDDNRKVINELLKYPEHSAGSIMTTEFIDLKSFMTVEEAFQKIKKFGVDKETLYTCYVLNESRELIGIVSARSLLLAERDQVIKDIMNTNLVTVNTLDDQEDVGNLISKYDVLALPVVDSENRLVGIVTVDDAIDVIYEEATEDFEKMAAMSPNKEEYFKTSTFGHTRNRIVWLIILMLSSIVAGLIITHYEESFAALPVLVSFIPMLMSTAGNCGSQTSTLIIRGLSVQEIAIGDIWKVLWKEIRVSALIGVLLSILIGVTIMVMYGDIKLVFVVGFALIATITMAKILGCTLPLLAKKLKFDPAVMATPLITTIVDILAILLYFTIAVAVFQL